MFRSFSNLAKTVVVAAAALVAAGVVSPHTLAGRSPACAADGTAACRLSDLRNIDAAALWRSVDAVQAFAGDVASAWDQLGARIDGVIPGEAV